VLPINQAIRRFGFFAVILLVGPGCGGTMVAKTATCATANVSRPDITPFVDDQKCTGCGICTYRCHTRFVVQEKRLDVAAITISAENEHRRLTFPTDPILLGATDT